MCVCGNQLCNTDRLQGDAEGERSSQYGVVNPRSVPLSLCVCVPVPARLFPSSSVFDPGASNSSFLPSLVPSLLTAHVDVTFASPVFLHSASDYLLFFSFFHPSFCWHPFYLPFLLPVLASFCPRLYVDSVSTMVLQAENDPILPSFLFHFRGWFGWSLCELSLAERRGTWTGCRSVTRLTHRDTIHTDSHSQLEVSI